jgi:hypothetical protein
MDPKEIRRGMVWIDVARDGNKWRAVVNKAMNSRIP